MKKIILALLFLNKLASAQNPIGLENIIVEKYYISDAHDSLAPDGHLPVGSVTYRIYVDMLPDYKFQAAFGLPGHELRLATTTSFFNNEDRGDIIPNVVFHTEKNTVMLDSWLSVGAASDGHFGILKTDDDTAGTVIHTDGFLQNTNPIAGIPLKIRDGLMAGIPERVSLFGIDSIVRVLFGNKNNTTKGALLFTTAGSWLCLNGAKGPTPANRLLIAQLTTDGVFSFELNIQIGAPDGSIQKYVAKNPIENEYQLPGLIYSSSSATDIKKSKKVAAK